MRMLNVTGVFLLHLRSALRIHLPVVIVCMSGWPVTAAGAVLTSSDYARAERFLWWNAETVVNGDIQHHWIGMEDRFWYLRTTEKGGKEFVVIDAATGNREPAFDRKLVATGLARAMSIDVNSESLPFATFRYNKHKTAIQFEIDNTLWTCELKKASCAGDPVLASRPEEVVSPDGRFAAFIRDDNLWIRPTAGGTEFALSTDGVEHYGYSSLPENSGDAITDVRHHKSAIPQVIWSPNSRYLLTHRLDERKVKDLFLVQSVPEDGSLRPKLYTYRYAFPGDENVPKLEPLVFDVMTRRQTAFLTPPLIGTYPTLITSGYTWWSLDSAKIYYLNNDRFSKSISLNIADPATGRVTELLRDTSKTWLHPGAGIYFDNPSVRVLNNGDVIWYSERDGWGHLYYYDGSTGRVRNQITHGPWVVRGLVRVDEAARKLYFAASGREPDRDPYFEYLYSVNMDGTGLTLLTPEDAEHRLDTSEAPFLVLHPRSGALSSDRDGGDFSPSGRYFVYSYSRPNMPPTFALRTAAGRLVKELETAGDSALRKGGYTPPESFQVMAADGKTAIYGNLFRPSSFDSHKKYPIIDSIHGIPPITRTTKDFMGTAFDVFGAQALAELGFVVITIDGRGTPHRSKAFQDNSYGNLGTAGNLDDHIGGIRQLALNNSYIDLDRVGVYGVSGGGYASAHAILTHPEFYKVAVSGEGNHDQRGYARPWGETFNGPLGEGDYRDAANETFAENLSGKLLLVHGDMDDNVSPSLTMKVVDGLIKANKDFDLLIIPNGNHIAFLSPYFIRREWDYFVRNLLKAEPPSGYEIRPPEWAKQFVDTN